MFYAHCAGALFTFLIQIRILTSYAAMIQQTSVNGKRYSNSRGPQGNVSN